MRKITVKIDTVYSDGSGAPAVVIAFGCYFAADFVNSEARLHGLSNKRYVPGWVMDAAERAYSKALHNHPAVTAEWYEKHRALYATNEADR